MSVLAACMHDCLTFDSAEVEDNFYAEAGTVQPLYQPVEQLAGHISMSTAMAQPGPGSLSTPQMHCSYSLQVGWLPVLRNDLLLSCCSPHVEKAAPILLIQIAYRHLMTRQVLP